MNIREYTLDELLKHKRRWSSVSTYDIITKFLPEAAQDNDKLSKFVKHFSTHYTFLLQGIILSSKKCIYPLHELFKQELQEFPNKNIHRYGSADIGMFINLLKKSICRGHILLPKQKEKFLYQAINTLSSDDYRTLFYILEQKLSDEIADKLYDNVTEQYKQLFKRYYKIKEISDDYDITKSDKYLLSDNLKKFIVLPNHSIALELVDNDSTKFVENISEEMNFHLNQLFKYISKTSSCIFLFDGKRFVGEVLHDGSILFYSNTKLTTLNLPEFDTNILSGTKYILNENGIIFDSSKVKRETITAKSFEVIENNSFYDSIVLLKLKTADSEINVKILKDSASNIAKNTKKFNLINFKNSYYFTTK